MLAVKEYAYAKINLFLGVRQAREDGFHELSSIMHATGLCDELTVSYDKSGSGIRLRIVGDAHLPCDGRNIACAAAELFMTTLGISGGVSITIKKNIPIAAGLAGGSADAAATLRALNRLLSRPLTQRALCDMGAVLGSDVPFCIVGGTALCEGRGERVTPLRHGSYYLVIAKSDERVSTKEAYARLDEYYMAHDEGDAGDTALATLLDEVKAGKAPSVLYNSFEAPILPTVPEAMRIKRTLYDCGARLALMSGSGPSVFGIFDTQSAASAAASALLSEGFFAVSCVSAPKG